MKRIIVVALSITSSLCYSWLVEPAFGECYGDAAEAYGCGVSAAASSGTRAAPRLEMFGANSGPLLPDTGYNQYNSNPNDVITPEERHKMMRSIVLGKGKQNGRSRSAHINAVNSAARPLRRSGSMPAVGR